MEKSRKEVISALQRVKGKNFLEDHDLISGGFLDSFELLMFVKELENCFDIRIPLEKINPEEFNRIDSVYEIMQKIVEDNN